MVGSDGGIKMSLKNRAQIGVQLAESSLFTETDPTVPDWVKERASPEFLWSEIVDAPQEIDNTEIEDLIKNMGGI